MHMQEGGGVVMFEAKPKGSANFIPINKEGTSFHCSILNLNPPPPPANFEQVP